MADEDVRSGREQMQDLAEIVCSALDGAPHGFVVVAGDGTVLAANGTLKRWAGHDDPIVGKALRGFRLSQRGDLLAAVVRAAQGEALSFETDQIELVPDARGSFRVQVGPWSLGPRNAAACLFIYDVTDLPGSQHAAETSFRQLFDAAPEALLVVRGSVVLYANRAACAGLGYAWQDDLVGRSVFDFVRSLPAEPELGETTAAHAVETDVLNAQGMATPSTIAWSRLMIDDAPTSVLSLRLGSASGGGMRPPAPPPAQLQALQCSIERITTAVEHLRASVPRTSELDARTRDLEVSLQALIDVAREVLAHHGGGGTSASGGDDGGEGKGAVVEGNGMGTEARRTQVLVCDDEARLAMLTAGLLDQYGFDSVTVATAAEALVALAAGGSDVVLLDMNLPDGSAEQVISGMKERGIRTPVILMSGYAEEDVEPRLRSDPLVSSYLAKPYTVDHLIQAVRRALGA